MTQEEPESISSGEMELSKPWPEVVRLGRRIASELGLTRNVDTLGRWMAYRIAELMDRVEHAGTAESRELAERECTDLIMRLWEHRASRSHGRPLAEIADFLQQFTSTTKVFQRSAPNKLANTWTRILPHLINLHDREEGVCRAAALAGFSSERDQEWLAEHADDLSGDEKRIIPTIIELQNITGSVYLDRGDFARLSPEDRTEHALQVLAEIESERRQLLDAVRQSGGYANEGSLESSEPIEAADNEDS